MKKYLSELHTKPHSHKKRFALLVSGGATLFIFAIWLVVRVEGSPKVVKDTTGPVNLAAASEASSVGLMFDGIKSSWSSLKELVGNGR